MKAVRVGEPRGVEPVDGQALAEVGIGQEPIDEAVVSVVSLVLNVRVDPRRRRRQACEVERETADQGGSIGFRGRGEPLVLEALQDERIDPVPWPRAPP